MAEFVKTTLLLDKDFDPARCRHYLNGELIVFHCHHYTSLYTQLAMDCEFVDAKKLLADSMEDAIYPIMADYFEDNEIEDITDRFAIAQDLYSAVGLGKMKVVCAGDFSGEVSLERSHVDEGWLKKWGKGEKPVNYITVGFIGAMFAAVFDGSPRSYDVTETKSLVCGDSESRFKVVAL
jgi:hypothetical protein